MTSEATSPSARQAELLQLAYRYVLTHGLAELSLRPLAAAIGSSPRVLLFLFGSKDGLIKALLAQAREDELELLHHLDAVDSLNGAVNELWTWLSSDHHRPLLTLWAEAYTRSLVDPEGVWSGFAHSTVGDWLAVLAAHQPDPTSDAAEAERTLALAVLRGALLDLLATGDRFRTSAAVRLHTSSVSARTPRPTVAETPPPPDSA
ncbi:TetR family transcriptional regulator [Mycobacterium sp. MS1601]|uniref:TetR/AcrR family transcriptional regulator n=1 Tax=Mycobacterium sp. MS1601 TaxID=1936029 RepID=UPI000979179F|nr:TetR family transcriptional regulator [Mycobacterium sp. MS1601]AQA05284.1 TetR family transcriptional regulator [Mycobacterium sp. MS1601]